MYKRKTEDEYTLEWDYGLGREVLGRYSSYREAKEDQIAYVENEGIYPKIVKHRVEISKDK